tara:strand:+ start:112 stop:492 length:381 start_codon:yes stop_codon:yes gene_type:complete
MASILRVNTITDASSNNSIATSVVFGGVAKCWGDYDQDTPSVKDSFNTSSITDHTTGQYDPQWSSNMGSVNYVTMSQSQPQSSVASCESFEDESAKTTGDTRIQTIENGSATDHTNNGYAVHGDLA